jgi:shikimate kinase
MLAATSLPTNPHRSFAFIGSPGCGKTTLGTQFPNVLVIDFDDNIAGALPRLRS